MQKPPSVAVIIPAYNEEESIEKCLLACLDQTVQADEIIIVNNRSTDKTVEIIERMIAQHPTVNMRLLHQDAEQGVTPTRNMGLDSAKSEILGRIDADAVIEPNWVEAVKEAFSDPHTDAITGPVLYHDMPLQKLGFRLDDRIRTTLYKLAKDYRFLFGSNMAIRAEAWTDIRHKISPDKDDLFHEDIDLALTLFENDYTITYVPDMVAGLSARRLEDSPKAFYNYVMRFERTYKAHGVKSASARVPIFIYLLIYFPVRTVRKFYDGDTNKFTFRKLREELKVTQDS